MIKKLFLSLFFLFNFVQGQDDLIDKKIGLKNTLEEKELRVYVKNSIVLNYSKTFVVKKNSKGRWKAKLYDENGRDNINVRKLKVRNGDALWEEIIANKPKIDTMNSLSFLDPDYYVVYLQNNNTCHHLSYDEPLSLRENKNDIENSIYSFFKLIEQRFRFKFKKC